MAADAPVFVSPGHQQQHHWLYRITKSLSAKRISCTCIISVLKSDRKYKFIHMLPEINSSGHGLIIYLLITTARASSGRHVIAHVYLVTCCHTGEIMNINVVWGMQMRWCIMHRLYGCYIILIYYTSKRWEAGHEYYMRIHFKMK